MSILLQFSHASPEKPLRMHVGQRGTALDLLRLLLDSITNHYMSFYTGDGALWECIDSNPKVTAYETQTGI